MVSYSCLNSAVMIPVGLPGYEEHPQVGERCILSVRTRWTVLVIRDLQILHTLLSPEQDFDTQDDQANGSQERQN